jgi:hypothetical protein
MESTSPTLSAKRTVTGTYGIAFCDHCSRPESFLGATWNYPGIDLRDFPQPLVEVEDVEALNFVTGLIDPFPGRKEAARRMLPEMWAELSNGEVFEIALLFASMQNADHWDKNRNGLRRREKSGDGWDRFTPEVLSVAGRAVLGGQGGLEQFGDLLRRLGQDKPREKTYGWLSELGPLGIVDPNLSVAAREILRRGVKTYFLSRQDADLKPIAHLAEKYGVERSALAALATSGLVPTLRYDHLEKAPVLMSETALLPLVHQRQNAISGTLVAPRIGLHRMYLGELERHGLLDRVEGPVLKMLKSDVYYTLGSFEVLKTRLSEKAPPSSKRDVVRLRVALRSLGIRDVPWATIISAIVDGLLTVTALKPYGSLGERLAIANVQALAELVTCRADRSTAASSRWFGKVEVAEMLGINEVAVWGLAKVGKLKQHDDAPMHAPFLRADVQRLAKKAIFTPEIVRIGFFQTYREASRWLKEQGIAPVLELKKAGWKLYSRADVEGALDKRLRAMPPEPPRRLPPPRAKGLLHGPDSPGGKLAAARESRDPSRVGFATAASILGCTIFSVQALARIGKLKASDEVTPFARADVEALAKEIVFVSEIMKRSGYVSHRGAVKFLANKGGTPLLCLKEGKVPVFDREKIEELLSKPFSVGGAHPRQVKDRLLRLVKGGTNVHQASIACEVNYATAKRWARANRAS